jgi:GAF domain-containing protein
MALTGVELRQLMERAAAEVAEVLSVEFCKVLELVPGEDRLVLRAGVGWREGCVGTATAGVNLESQAGYTLISAEPVVVEDLRTERRFGGSELLHEHGIVSGVSTTIRARGHLYGVLGAHSTYRRTFTEDEVLFVREVADVLGAAVERKQAERDTRKVLAERTAWAAAAERRFGFLAEANAALSASTDYETVVETAARLAVPDLADLCLVDVVEQPGGRVSRLMAARPPAGGRRASLRRDRYALDPSAPRGTPRVLRTGRPELVPEADERAVGGMLQGRSVADVLGRFWTGRASYVCVPLRVGGAALGALALVRSGGERRYGEEDLRLAEGLAHSAALAMDNARHHVPEAELARELVRRARREEIPPATPDRRDVPELTARQMEVLKLLAEGRSAKEIGGDLYLSQATVRNHIRSLLQALGAHSQLEALAMARRKGLLP